MKRTPKLREKLVAALGAARVTAVEAELDAYLETCIKLTIATPMKIRFISP